MCVFICFRSSLNTNEFDMQKYQSQIQIEIILVYRDIKHITGIYTCWLITEYIQFRPQKKPPRTNGQKMRLMKMVYYLTKTPQNTLDWNKMKTKMSSYLEYSTGIVGKWPILHQNIQPRVCVGADLKSCMPGQWMPLVSHCRKVRHSHLQCLHWHFMAFYYLLYHNINGKKNTVWSRH